MAVGKTFTSDSDPTADGLAMTYVVPAERCDLSCAFCYIRQRGEAENSALRPQDYVTFLREVAQAYPVRVSGLQGYEPLLDESWAYTTAILQASGDLSIPTSLVTNGTHLAARAPALAELGLKDITVSLDAASAAAHDKLRRTAGAFERTMAGVREALRQPAFASKLVVASVLLPNRRRHLDGMPRLLAGLGVPYFGVTPYIRLKEDGLGRFMQEHATLMADLEHLRRESERYGIRFVVDDELDQFRGLLDGANRFMVHSLSRPDRLLRLTPSGACSAGLDVLRPVTPATPTWRPGLESPVEFMRRLRVGGDLATRSEPQLCAAA